ncbi:hypothetical protein D3C86_1825630 [compost metagenome]
MTRSPLVEWKREAAGGLIFKIEQKEVEMRDFVVVFHAGVQPFAFGSDDGLAISHVPKSIAVIFNRRR